MKRVALTEMKDDFSRYLRIAASEEIVITRHGKPAGVLIGFESEDDWFEYRLENDPRFIMRIAAARASLTAGRGIRIEDLEKTIVDRKRSAVTTRPPSGEPASRESSRWSLRAGSSRRQSRTAVGRAEGDRRKRTVAVKKRRGTSGKVGLNSSQSR